MQNSESPKNNSDELAVKEALPEHVEMKNAAKYELMVIA